MGYSKAVAEKSLFLTQNSSVDHAVDWIMNHMEDADFEEELMIVQQSAAGPTSTLTKEEKLQKAKEM